jgi:hypothetical protein
VQTERVSAGVAVPVVPAGTADVVLDPQDPEDLLAINAILAQGTKVTRLTDGSVLVNRAAATAQANARGLTLKAAPASYSGATIADKVVVAYNGGSEVRDTLLALGFEGRAVTATTLTTTLTSDVDVLLVGATLNPSTLNAANKAALDAFLARRGGVVGLGTAGSAFTTNGGLLTATGTAAVSLASGVANVVNAGGPVSNGAQSTAFIFQPTWYTNLGSNAVVEQTFAADPLLSGWWRPNATNTNGQAQAAGKATIVRALSSGGNGVVLLGTNIITRLHSKGTQPQLGRALLWAAAPTATLTGVDGSAGGTVPATLALTLGAPATFGAFTPGVAKTYDASTTATVISTAGDAALTVTDPSTVAPGHLVNGSFSLPQPLQGLGTVKTWSAPTSNEVVTVPFKQAIGAGDALRTGTYAKTLTFTLSTTTP